MLCSTPRSHCVVFLRVHLISSTKCWLGVFSTTSASNNLLRTIPYHYLPLYRHFLFITCKWDRDLLSVVRDVKIHNQPVLRMRVNKTVVPC